MPSGHSKPARHNHKICPRERIHALLTDTGMPTAGSCRARLGQCHFWARRPDSDDVETTREHGDVVEVYLFHNHRNPDRSTNQLASACCLWISPGRNSLPLLPGQPNCLRKSSGSQVATACIHTRILVCPAVSSVCRVACQRKCQPPCRDAAAEKNIDGFWKTEPQVASHSPESITRNSLMS